MTNINLLPWREIRRKEQQRQFFSIAGGAAVLMGLIVFYIHIHVGGMIETQSMRNKFLEEEITKVEAKIVEIKTIESKKEQLLARMNIIQQLQTRRPAIVHLFDELVKAVPSGMYLTNVSQQGKLLVIEGVAQSNARVSAFMRNLDASDWFAGPRLEVIEASSKDLARTSHFKLAVSQETSEVEAEVEEMAKAGAKDKKDKAKKSGAKTNVKKSKPKK
ncbi:MAG: PilN domain-containing protein [Gammaproteobacteria bacterium]|nr:PilN domain-containing protein [Gammaproteobacteria bacterium]